MDYVELPIDTTIKKIIEDRKQFSRDLVKAYKQGLIQVGISQINNDLRLEEINQRRGY
tara:strand:- start:331 stop:504 length:174 start_codon:yes stop_codon:yes gene_type:complete